jgi:hypothetical protein
MHATSDRLHPWPLGVRAVSPLVVVFAEMRILRMSFGLCTPLASPSVSLGFNVLAL